MSSAQTLLHDSAYNLHSEDFDLKAKLHSFVRHVNKTLPVEVTVLYDVPSEGVNRREEQLVFRVVCELIQNIIKHAAATRAIVEVRFSAEMAMVAVADDGQGFDPESQEEGIGLRYIRNIVSHHSGSISISNESGTEIRLTLPYDSDMVSAQVLSA